MFEQTRTMTRVVSIAASFALTAALGLSGLTIAASTQAFADEHAGGETAKTDISTIGISNCCDKCALSGVVDGAVPLAMAYDASIRDKDRNRIHEAADCKATYDWCPAMANGSSSTAGATEVPTIFTLQYDEGSSATTATAIADDLKTQITDGVADIQYVSRTFVGATESEYADGIGGNRFPTNASVFTVTGFMPFDNITDVPEDVWFTPWIAEAVNKGIMKGYSGTTEFGPNDTLSRAQAITVLYRAANPDSTDTTDSADFAVNDTPLTDNTNSQYYTAAVNWAYENEITTGYDGQNLFGVNDNISRQDLATILARYANKVLGVDTDSATGEVAAACPDWDVVASYAKEAIEWTADNDIMSGVATDHGTYLQPTADTQRSHMAKMILQTLDVAAE